MLNKATVIEKTQDSSPPKDSPIVRFTKDDNARNLLLNDFGFADKYIQNTLRKTHDLTIDPEIILSPIFIDEGEARDKIAQKYQDLSRAILSMNSQRKTLIILLPIGHAIRHGFPNLSTEEIQKKVQDRLNLWEKILGLKENALAPLAKDEAVTISNQEGITFNFPVWDGTYLSAEMKICIDEMKSQINDIFLNNFDSTSAVTFLQQNNSLSLHNVISKQLKQSNIATQPLSQEELEHIIQCIVTKALLYMAQSVDTLKTMIAEATLKNRNNPDIDGALILRTLYSTKYNSKNENLATALAHEVAFIAEEVFVMLEKFKQKNYRSFYCGNHYIPQYDPMRVAANYMKIHSGYLALETCNSYCTREARNREKAEAIERAKQAEAIERAKRAEASERAKQLEKLGMMIAVLANEDIAENIEEFELIAKGIAKGFRTSRDRSSSAGTSNGSGQRNSRSTSTSPKRDSGNTSDSPDEDSNGSVSGKPSRPF